MTSSWKDQASRQRSLMHTRLILGLIRSCQLYDNPKKNIVVVGLTGLSNVDKRSSLDEITFTSSNNPHHFNYLERAGWLLGFVCGKSGRD